MEKQAKTWGELHALLAELDESQLDQPIKWWSESGAGEATVSVLDEDYFGGDDYLEPRSSFAALELFGVTPVKKKGELIINVS
jgi:hypothetical protein